METTIIYWGYMERMENGNYYYIYWDFLGIMENKMETTIIY